MTPQEKEGVELTEKYMIRFRRRLENAKTERQARWLRMAFMKEVLSCPEVVDETDHCRCSWFIELMLREVLGIKGCTDDI